MHVQLYTLPTAEHKRPPTPTDKLCGTFQENNCPEDVWRGEEQCLHQTDGKWRKPVFSLAFISFNLQLNASALLSGRAEAVITRSLFYC